MKAAKAAFHQAGGVVSAATSGMSQGPPAIVSHANGAKTPADTPEVQAAKTSHNMKVKTAKSAFRHAKEILSQLVMPSLPLLPLPFLTFALPPPLPSVLLSLPGPLNLSPLPC